MRLGVTSAPHVQCHEGREWSSSGSLSVRKVASVALGGVDTSVSEHVSIAARTQVNRCTLLVLQATQAVCGTRSSSLTNCAQHTATNNRFALDGVLARPSASIYN